MTNVECPWRIGREMGQTPEFADLAALNPPTRPLPDNSRRATSLALRASAQEQTQQIRSQPWLTCWQHRGCPPGPPRCSADQSSRTHARRDRTRWATRPRAPRQSLPARPGPDRTNASMSWCRSTSAAKSGGKFHCRAIMPAAWACVHPKACFSSVESRRRPPSRAVEQFHVDLRGLFGQERHGHVLQQAPPKTPLPPPSRPASWPSRGRTAPGGANPATASSSRKARTSDSASG